MLKKIVNAIGGDPNKKAIEAYRQIVLEINALEAEYEALSDEQLSAKTNEFKQRLESGETLDDLLIEAYATVREAGKRTLGQRHYDVQLIGGIILHQGNVAEMRTGEGKTLMATLPLYLNALSGKGVHLITVNDYLARRDARWMTPIYHMLGLTVGVLQMGSRTESGRKAFLVNLDKEHAQEDQDQLDMVDRNLAYEANITYGTNNEFGFDYLRDNMRLSLDQRVQSGHNFAIIDEVDNVLIDEARTPLIISGPSHDDAENYVRMAQVVKRLKPGDYEINEKDRTINLTELGEMRVEQTLGVALRDPDRPEDVTPEQARMLGYLEQALRAQFLFHRNKEYLVQGGQVIIVDEFTGRLMPGRRWSDGLHQAVEAKENVNVQSENITHATITIQNYFRMYEKLAGMTGTAMTEAEEFDNIYSLDVLAIPPNVEYNTFGDAPLLKADKDKDEYGYEYTYYAYANDAEQKPVFYKRKDYPDVIYRTEEAKLRALIQEIIEYQVVGRPQLVGTTSVESSERLANRLRPDMILKLLQVLLLRKVWFDKNDRAEDGRTVMALSFLNEPLDKLNRGEMSQLAKQLDMTMSVESPENIKRLLYHLNLEPRHQERLEKVIKNGIPTQVLNARKHTEESQIIAGAGAFGAVTIATNMAGRGVDIKLGGEIAEEILSVVNRVLSRTGIENPYEMTMEERLAAIRKLSPDQYGIYETEIKFYIKSMEDMKQVKELGGLHVVGSERHEARRIDNQLRGRAARQGDPGSSRFFLSMEDELMRLFGGQQVDNMMQRMGLDDAMPLEHNMVSRIIEQSQTRVEGANFDARKHLLEYDDVLNSQRQTIYNQRDRIFVKEDLTDDVREMLETEISQRIPTALEDPEGPWKLLAWLEQIQPTLVIGNIVFPSFTFQLLIDHLMSQPHDSKQEAFSALIDLAKASISSEEEHLLDATQASLEMMQVRLEDQIDERIDSLDTFFDVLRHSDPAEQGSPKEMADELTVSLGVPLNLSGPQQRMLRDDPDEAYDLIEEQVERFLYTNTISRMIGVVERRLNESIDLSPSELASEEWETITEKILEKIQAYFQNRRDRLIGEQQDGALAKDVQNTLDRIDSPLNAAHMAQLLMTMPRGEVMTFDKRTHRQVKQRTVRLTYNYYTAHLLEISDPEEMTERVLKHLDNAQDALKRAWGMSVWDQVKNSPLAMMEKSVRETVEAAIGKPEYDKLKGKPLAEAQGEQRGVIMQALGRRGVTEAYRQLILRVISELWIEYITKMEALRVSIGLEAYAQRDPLVQYKARASEMFQQLFSDMRLGVITRMFTFRPRQQTQAAQQQAQATVPQPKEDKPAQKQQPSQGSGGKKRRRRRRKKK